MKKSIRVLCLVSLLIIVVITIAEGSNRRRPLRSYYVKDSNIDVMNIKVIRYSDGTSDVYNDGVFIFNTDADTITSISPTYDIVKYEFRNKKLIKCNALNRVPYLLAQKGAVQWLYTINGTELIQKSNGISRIRIVDCNEFDIKTFYFNTYKDGLQGIVDMDGSVLFSPDYYKKIRLCVSYDRDNSDINSKYQLTRKNGLAKITPILFYECTTENNAKGICDINGNVIMHPNSNIDSCFPLYDYYDNKNHLIGFVVSNHYKNGIVGLFDNIVVPLQFSPGAGMTGEISWLYGLNHSVFWQATYDNGKTVLISPIGDIIYTKADGEDIHICTTDQWKEFHDGNYEWIEVYKDGPDFTTIMKVLDIHGHLLYNWQPIQHIVYQGNKLLGAEVTYNPNRVIRTFPLKKGASSSNSSNTHGCSMCWGNKVCPVCHGQRLLWGVSCVCCGGRGICPGCNGTGISNYIQASPSWDQYYYSYGGIGAIQSSIVQDDGGISSSESTKVSINSCPRCHGSGRVAIETFPPQFGSEDYYVKCNECGQSFLKSMGHTHITCPVCHGHKD